MPHDKSATDAAPTSADDPAERPPLTPAARRALAEAEERRKAAAAAEAANPRQTELGGRDGPDPVRFGDWEKGGIISDF